MRILISGGSGFIGTNLAAFSEDAGFYRLVGVSAGEVTLNVSYTGTEAATAKVNVSAGQTATRDFELQFRPSVRDRPRRSWSAARP